MTSRDKEIQDLDKDSVTTVSPLERAKLAHELAHGLTFLSVLTQCLSDTLSTEGKLLTSSELQEARRLTDSIRHEIDSQFYEALNVLWYRLPSLVDGLVRPEIVRQKPTLVFTEMLPAYRSRAARRRIDIRCPPDDADVPIVQFERNSIRRVFHNAMSNAIKYSYHGVEVTDRYVSVDWRRHDQQGRWWAMRFENYGIGILEREREQVFKPGFRGIMAQEEHVFGSGLGLACIHDAMSRLGGSCHISSKPLHDKTYRTTLTLVFPVAGLNEASHFHG